MNYQIIESNGAQNRLTIAPDRIALKILTGTDKKVRVAIISFVEEVIEEFGPVQQTWRGKVRLMPTRIGVSLQTHDGKLCKHFYRDFTDPRG